MPLTLRTPPATASASFPASPPAGIIHDENFHVHLPFFLAGVAKRIEGKDLRVPSASISLITYFHRK